LHLGFDTGDRLLETVVVALENGDEMVIHAMPARKTYLDLDRVSLDILPAMNDQDSSCYATLEGRAC
jgi:hypothetical protein